MKSTFTLFLFLLHLTLHASSNGTVTGQVLDADGEALPYATVRLLNGSDSSMVTAAFSDEEGGFALEEVAEGLYRVQVSYTSMEAFVSEAFRVEKGEAKVMGDIVLQEGGMELDAVAITARKSLISVKPNMTVFNVGESRTAIGANALELLRKAPGVTVDNRDAVMLQGKSGVRIYIDGKPSPLSTSDLAAMLRALPASQIESIEIITNPSARYEAEGTAGIINIVLKKEVREGGNVNVDLGYSVQRNSRFNGALSGNYRNERVNVFGSLSQTKGAQHSYMHLHRVQNGFVYDQTLNTLDDSDNWNAKAGLDISLSEKSSLGFMASGFFKENEQSNHSLTEIRQENSLALAGGLDALSQNQQDQMHQSFNANFTSTDMEKGTWWNVNADYAFFDLNAETYQPNSYLDSTLSTVTAQHVFSTEAPTNIDLATFKVDHERDFLNGTLGIGGKASFVRTVNDFRFFEQVEGVAHLSAEHSNRFDYAENVNAAYASWQGTMGNWELNAGMRMEQTNSSGQLTATTPSSHNTVSRSYLDFFPSAGLAYTLNEGNTFRLNYSRRIDRPRYQDLNPFLNRLDELTYQQGNPFLQPQYTHSFELTHVLQQHVSTSIKYSHTTDLMTELADTIEGNRGYLTQVNLASQEVLGLYLSVPYEVGDFWSTYTNVGVYHTRNRADFEAAGKVIDLAQTTWSLYHQSTFNLPGDYAIEVSGFFNSPSIWGANFSMAAFGGMDIGASKRFLEGRGCVKVAVCDVLGTMEWEGTQTYGGLYFEGRGGWESRQLKANFSYLFGNDKLKRGKKRKAGLESERSRAVVG